MAQVAKAHVLPAELLQVGVQYQTPTPATSIAIAPMLRTYTPCPKALAMVDGSEKYDVPWGPTTTLSVGLNPKQFIVVGPHCKPSTFLIWA